MAKVLLGAGTVDQRKKLAGWAYTKSRYGTVVKQKTYPINRQSARQQAQRSRFRTLTSIWRTISEAERSGWNNNAKDFPVWDAFGRKQILTGHALFNRLNSNLLSINSDIRTTPPEPAFPGSADILSTNFQATGHIMQLNMSTLYQPAAGIALLYATPQLSPTINYYQKLYQFIFHYEWDSSTLVFDGQYIPIFGNLIPGKKIAVKMILVHYVTGEPGVPVTAVGLIGS